MAADLKEKTMDVGNLLTFGMIPGLNRPGQEAKANMTVAVRLLVIHEDLDVALNDGFWVPFVF